MRRNTIVLLVALAALVALRHILSDLGVSSTIAGLMVVYIYVNTPKAAKADLV